MNDADREAFEAAFEIYDQGSLANYDHVKYGFQAALEWRDSQVGEPVGHIMIDAGDFEHGTKEYHLDGNWEPVYTTPPTAQINQQLVKILKELLDMDLAYQRGSKVCDAIERAQAALTAAKGK